jgi:hypothetical protein
MRYIAVNKALEDVIICKVFNFGFITHYYTFIKTCINFLYSLS